MLLLTSTDLSKVIEYNSESGKLFWKKCTKRIKLGDVAGCYEKNGYVKIRIFGRLYSGHRVAWALYYGEWPKGKLDHKDGNKHNNAINNLRRATNSQNQCNMGVTKRSRSGVKGVHWDKERSKWVAFIGIQHKSIFLGRFDVKEEAAKAYIKAALELHGNFARVK